MGVSVVRSMRCDTSGVAGFFEDLPVLLLVLAGVSSVVLTGAWCSEQRADSAGHDDLSAEAELLVRAALLAASGGRSSLVTVDALLALSPEDLAEAGSSCVGWTVVVEIVYPTGERHELSSGSECTFSCDLGWACELVNAAYDGDRIAIAEVIGIAW